MLPFLPDAIVFDMDGLLFDSEQLYLEAFLAAANEGKYNAGRDTFLPMLGRSWQENRAHLSAQLGPGASADDFRALWQRQFEQRLAADAALPALKTGARELIDLAVTAGLPIAIATSSSHATVQHHLTAHGLSGHFHAIVAHGDYARSKPQPDPYLKARRAA
jgi:beta-phosphoglucomutase-like phosphatase (HAD superfamily)